MKWHSIDEMTNIFSFFFFMKHISWLGLYEYTQQLFIQYLHVFFISLLAINDQK